MNWYLLQKLNKDGEAGKDSLTRHSCFEIRACTELWHSNKFIVDELSARGYLDCVLVRCTEDEMLEMTGEGAPFKRRRLSGSGPYDCISLSEADLDQLLILLHVTDRYPVFRNVRPLVKPVDKSVETKSQEVLRGLLRGLKGNVVCDRANLRKFTPHPSLPGLNLLLLLPPADLKPYTKVEYESMKLKMDTSACWYLILAKNIRHLQHAFRLSVRAKVKEGIITEELGLTPFESGMPFPEGISQVRYFYQPGRPLPKHYFFVYTTLADVQYARVRSPYARVSIVWSHRYEPVSLTNKELEQLIFSVEGKQQELSAYMKRFVESLQTGDKVGFFLSSLQDLPFKGTVTGRKGRKIKVVDTSGRKYTIPQESVVPPKNTK